MVRHQRPRHAVLAHRDQHLAVPEPDDAKLQETYDSNKGQFVIPEFRKLGALLLTLDELKKRGLAIPQSAVIDDGARKVALIDRGEGLFAVRNMTLGRRGGDYVEVREGLKEGERLVVAGTFLMDSESNLQSALQAFTASEGTQ